MNNTQYLKDNNLRGRNQLERDCRLFSDEYKMLVEKYKVNLVIVNNSLGIISTIDKENDYLKKVQNNINNILNK